MKKYIKIVLSVFAFCFVSNFITFANTAVYVPSDANGPGMLNIDNAHGDVASTSSLFNESDLYIDNTKIAPTISSASELVIAKYTHIPYSYKARLVAIVEKSGTAEQLCRWIAKEVEDQEMADYRAEWNDVEDKDNSIDQKIKSQNKAEERKIKMFEYQDLIEDLLDMIVVKCVVNDERRVKLSYLIKGQDPND